MADLAALLGKARKGAAAEDTLRYFGDELRKAEREAADVVEGAYSAGDDRRRDIAVGRWIAVRQLLRQFDRDIKQGESASKEVNTS